MAKIQKSVRFDEIAKRQLSWLTRQTNKSESEIIALALDGLFKSRQAHAWSIISQMTDADIDEQIRQLSLPDGDENAEHPDMQYT